MSYPDEEYEADLEIGRLTAIVAEVHNWIVVAGIASNEDMAQNFSRIAAITAPGASVEDPSPRFPNPDGPIGIMKLSMVASTGYEVQSEYPVVTPKQYGDVVGILHGTVEVVKK